MRGRLIFPFIAELHRLDTQAMAPDYDEDFKEPVRDAFVTLRFDQDRIHIPRLAFHMGASDLRISG